MKRARAFTGWAMIGWVLIVMNIAHQSIEHKGLQSQDVVTEMVHGRARAPPRQTWRVAVNEVGWGYPQLMGAASFYSLKTAISKRDVITYSWPHTLVNHTLFRFVYGASELRFRPDSQKFWEEPYWGYIQWFCIWRAGYRCALPDQQWSLLFRYYWEIAQTNVMTYHLRDANQYGHL